MCRLSRLFKNIQVVFSSRRGRGCFLILSAYALFMGAISSSLICNESFRLLKNPSYNKKQTWFQNTVLISNINQQEIDFISHTPPTLIPFKKTCSSLAVNDLIDTSQINVSCLMNAPLDFKFVAWIGCPPLINGPHGNRSKILGNNETEKNRLSTYSVSCLTIKSLRIASCLKSFLQQGFWHQSMASKLSLKKKKRNS